eukprot:93723-Alexandrium_andersonii.AAC.1
MARRNLRHGPRDRKGKDPSAHRVFTRLLRQASDVFRIPDEVLAFVYLHRRGRQVPFRELLGGGWVCHGRQVRRHVGLPSPPPQVRARRGKEWPR